MAIMLMAKVERMAVCLESRFLICGAEPSRFSSMTTRMPSRSLSSRRSAMPSTFFSRTRLAIFSMSEALFTW